MRIMMIQPNYHSGGAEIAGNWPPSWVPYVGGALKTAGFTDIQFVDANLPDMSIGEFVGQMRALQADAGVTASKLLILGDRPESACSSEAEAVQAEGYCCKDAPIEAMAEIIRQIYAGVQPLDPAIA